MAGLLGAQEKLRGLLSMAALRNSSAAPQDPRADSVASSMGALKQRFGGEGQRQALLSSMQPQAQPQRERVSGWRVLDRVLGGQTISEGLDSERERETARAMQGQGGDPRMMAVANTIHDPRELALFAMDPAAWSKNVGEQFAPQVVGAGAAQVIGGRRVVDQPQNMQSGDTIVQVGSGGANPIFTRTTPSIAEAIDARQANTQQFQAETGRMEANKPITLSQDARLVRPDGTPVAEGNRSAITLSQGEQAFTPDGRPIASVAPAPRDRPTDVVDSETLIRTMESDVFPILQRQRELLESGLVFTGPLAEQQLAMARLSGSENDRARVRATEEYLASSGLLRAGMAKSLGANPSDADLRLLELVTAGDIGQSREGLVAVVGQNTSLAERRRDAARGVVSGWQSQQSPQGAQAPQGVVSVNSPEEAAQLPPGTRFRTPDGRVLVRQ